MLGVIQNPQFVDNQFHLSGRNVLVDGIGVAQLDGARHRDDIFVAQELGLVVDRGVPFLTEDDLRHARAVSQIHKNELYRGRGVGLPIPSEWLSFRHQRGAGLRTCDCVSGRLKNRARVVFSCQGYGLGPNR